MPVSALLVGSRSADCAGATAIGVWPEKVALRALAVPKGKGKKP